MTYTSEKKEMQLSKGNQDMNLVAEKDIAYVDDEPIDI